MGESKQLPLSGLTATPLVADDLSNASPPYQQAVDVLSGFLGSFWKTWMSQQRAHAAHNENLAKLEVKTDEIMLLETERDRFREEVERQSRSIDALEKESDL